MVAAQSLNSSKPSVLSASGSNLRPSPDYDASKYEKHQLLQSTEICILHLRLLTAFSQLRHAISNSNEVFSIPSQEPAQAPEQRWTIFVAKAVGKFERWLASCVRPKLDTEWPYTACPDETLMDTFQRKSSLQWSEISAPPLDVLMVLHSYMLNPRGFLQDCLRCNAIAIWKAGFPWEFTKAYLGSTEFAYNVPESIMKAYEQATGDQWNTGTEPDTSLSCSNCGSTIIVPWSDLYPGNISEMEKGNTEMPFALACSNCQNVVTQSSACLRRFERDLKLLHDHDVPMPGTLLRFDGQVKQVPTKAGHPLLLNNILRSTFGRELLVKTRMRPSVRNLSQLSTSIISCIEDAINHPSVDENLAKELEGGDKLLTLRRANRRMIAVYDRNHLPFALDLVGAVMRQGTFISKMREFDWIHSPAQEHHVRYAIDRYVGFFKVMQQHPDNVAVPTFDVDLVWHTHQLSPPSYYDFTLKYCNDTFIDHDDKIVDNVLSNSFEWTCDEYTKITGLPYDKCLCWCCALLEADYLERSKKTGSTKKIKIRLRNVFTRFTEVQMSEAETKVMQIQIDKFDQDYAKASRPNSGTGVAQESKKAFFETYVWHYPMYAPSPKTVAG